MAQRKCSSRGASLGGESSCRRGWVPAWRSRARSTTRHWRGRGSWSRGPREAQFAYGVASGIPSPKAITLWTRLKGIDRSVEAPRSRSPPTPASITSSGSHDVRAEAGPGLHRSHARRRPDAVDAVPLPVRDRGRRVTRRAPSARCRRPTRTSSFGSASTRARATRPATTRRRRRSPRSRTSTSSSASGDYIYEHHYYDGPAARVDKTGSQQGRRRPDPRRVPRRSTASTSPTRTSRTCTRRIRSS